MSLASVPSSAPPYVHCSTCRYARGPVWFFFSSPHLSVVLLCAFVSFVHRFNFFVFSPFLLFPAAVAIAADAGHPATAQCNKDPSGGVTSSSCSVSSRGSSRRHPGDSLSSILCEDEVVDLPEYYAVVVDSGSTGTRAFVYKVRVEEGSCGDVQRVFPDEEEEQGRTARNGEWGNEGTKAAADVFHPLSRAIVQVPAVATRRIGPGIALFAKRETGRKKGFEDPLGIENMTEERMRKELLDDEHLILESEKAGEQERRERQRLAARTGKAAAADAEAAATNAAAATDAGAAHERFGRQEDVEESLEKYLGELRNFVLAVVPAAAREQKRAFLFFRGTAGMRALPLEQQQKLLDRVRASLSTWGLLLPPGAAGASVLTGAEEGVLGWVALNQLLGNFRSSDALLSFAAGRHRLCPSQQQQRQDEGAQQDAPAKDRTGGGEKQWPEKSRTSSSNSEKTNTTKGSEEHSNASNSSSSDSPRSSSSAWRAGLVEMGGASAQVVFQLPAEARAANLLTTPFLSPPPSPRRPVGFGDSNTAAVAAAGAAAGNAPSSTAKHAARQQLQQDEKEERRGRQQQQHPGQAVLRAVDPSERLFEKGETRQYPPVRRHRGPYAAEDFFEVDLCRSRHVVYSKSFLGLGRQHALLQHIHESVSEAMEERRRQMEQGAEPLPTRDFPVEAAVPCLPADVRVHVNASPAAAVTFDEDFSKMVQEEQQDLEEHAAAAAAVKRRQQKQQRRSSSSRAAAEKARTDRRQHDSETRAEAEAETKGEEEEGTEQLRWRKTNGKARDSGLFAAAGAATGERYGDSETETREYTEEEEEEEEEKLAKWKKLPRPGVAEKVETDETLQVLFKKQEANVLQEIESVAAQGTSDGTACMHKMAQTMMRVGRLPFEIHRDMQLYATENFYHFNEYVLQARGRPDFTVDVFSREGRKLCFLQQVEEVHKRLHPGAAREKAQTACFGLMFMSEFLRRVVGLERDRVLLAVNDLYDVEISWTAAVPMLYMPHVLLHQQAVEAEAAAAATPAATTEEAAPAAAAAPVATADAAQPPAAAGRPSPRAAGAGASAGGSGEALNQQHQQQVSKEEAVKEAAATLSFATLLKTLSHEEL